MMDDSSLRFDAVVNSGDWGRQLSDIDWIREDTFIGIGCSTAYGAFEFFSGAQVRAVDALGSPESIVSAIAELVPKYFRLLVSDLGHERVLWQNEVGGPLEQLEVVSAEREHRFPHPRKRCPLGHVMPQKNTHETLDHFFGIHHARQFDSGASRYEAQLQQYFSLNDERARGAWLDERDHGLGGGTHAERLDAFWPAGAEPFARCTERCGCYHWQGKWLQTVGMHGTR